MFSSNNPNVLTAYNNIISDKYSTNLHTKQFSKVDGFMLGDVRSDVKNRFHLCAVATDYINNSILLSLLALSLIFLLTNIVSPPILQKNERFLNSFTLTCILLY